MKMVSNMIDRVPSVRWFLVVLFAGSLWYGAQLDAPAAETDAVMPLPELRLSLKDAMDAAMGNNPTVKLFKERGRAGQGCGLYAVGDVVAKSLQQCSAVPPNIFLGTVGLTPHVTSPFSIFDARVSATQSLFSLSLIDRWRASREALKVAELESDTAKNDAMGEVGLLYGGAAGAGDGRCS